jgi:VWFA-related protein
VASIPFCFWFVSAQASAFQVVDPVNFPPDGVIRVAVDVVLVDAIVTTKDGRHVKDLQAGDFEIYEDGQLRKITNLSYILAQKDSIDDRNRTREKREVETARDAPRPPVMFSRPRPEQVRRSIAVVVDDIGMSFENLASVRSALEELVDTQLQPFDLVAIAMTGARMGALQQFTMDSRQLRAAIERLRWNPRKRASPLDSTLFDRGFSEGMRGEAAHERNLVVAALNTLRFIVEGMKELPGRKSVILISEGFRLWYGELEGVGGSSYVATEAVARLTRAAHQAGVVVYAIDPRGLEPLGLTGRDDVGEMIERVQTLQQEGREARDRGEETDPSLQLIQDLPMEMIVDQTIRSRSSGYQDTKQGLSYLPEATGGLFLHMGNDINQHLQAVLEDQRGYYLIGYAPELESIGSDGRRRFPKISVKVKNPDLQVRFRSSFIGILEDEETFAALSADEQMIRALTSPFGSNEILLNLAALYEYDPKSGNHIRSWLHIAPGQLAFVKEEGGEQKAVFEILVAAFGEKDRPMHEESQMITVHADGPMLERIQQDGLVYRMTVPIKKAGPCQMCVVLRDKTTNRLGAASRFVEIPNMKKDRLALSGIVVLGTDPGAPGILEPFQETGVAEPLPPANMSVRKFKRGMRLNYALYIYNATLDRSSREPKLETQVRLYWEGREVYAGDLSLYDSVRLSEGEILMADGYFDLGDRMKPGSYILQYVVVDKLADSDHNNASQWIDFEIVG